MALKEVDTIERNEHDAYFMLLVVEKRCEAPTESASNVKRGNAPMEFDQIRELIELCAEKQICELNLEDNETKLKIQAVAQAPKVRYLATAQLPAAPPLTAPPSEIPPAPESQAPPENAAAETASGADENATAEVEEPDKSLIIKSPMVGTFYRAPAPDAEPFVEKGDLVKADTVLCIVEAMKLMNEIKAETSGRVVGILVDNAQPVEFGQPLFKLEL